MEQHTINAGQGFRKLAELPRAVELGFVPGMIVTADLQRSGILPHGWGTYHAAVQFQTPGAVKGNAELVLNVASALRVAMISVQIVDETTLANGPLQWTWLAPDRGLVAVRSGDTFTGDDVDNVALQVPGAGSTLLTEGRPSGSYAPLLHTWSNAEPAMVQTPGLVLQPLTGEQSDANKSGLSVSYRRTFDAGKDDVLIVGIVGKEAPNGVDP